jgi:hypothetical protein
LLDQGSSLGIRGGSAFRYDWRLRATPCGARRQLFRTGGERPAIEVEFVVTDEEAQRLFDADSPGEKIRVFYVRIPAQFRGDQSGRQGPA